MGDVSVDKLIANKQTATTKKTLQKTKKKPPKTLNILKNRTIQIINNTVSTMYNIQQIFTR